MTPPEEPAESPGDGFAELHLYGVDSYIAEAIRLATAGRGLWTVTTVAPPALPGVLRPRRAADAERPAPVTFGVVVTPIDLADVARTVFPAVPILAYGPPIALETLDATGADDYLVEPWSGEELRFRLSRLSGPRSVHFPGGVLSWGRYWVSGGTRRAGLTPHSYLQLDVLLRNAGESVSREVLSAVGRVGAYHAGDARSVGMQVSRLRARLAVATADWAVKPRIIAVRGRGFSVRPA